jgi:hypothetical protein
LVNGMLPTNSLFKVTSPNRSRLEYDNGVVSRYRTMSDSL